MKRWCILLSAFCVLGCGGVEADPGNAPEANPPEQLYEETAEPNPANQLFEESSR